MKSRGTRSRSRTIWDTRLLDIRRRDAGRGHARSWRLRSHRQSVRVVELLEDPYPNFPGLNLTFEVREGLRKHGAFHEMEDVTGPRAPAVLQSHRCSIAGSRSQIADEITLLQP